MLFTYKIITIMIIVVSDVIIRFTYILFLLLGGATGDIVLDSSGDRMPSYYYFKMGYNKAFDVVAQTEANTLPSGAISWVQSFYVSSSVCPSI